MSDSSNEDPPRQSQTNQNQQGRVIDAEPKMEVLIGEVIGRGDEARQEIKVGDWTLTRYGQEEEPRVPDLQIAKDLDFAQPRDIRKLIKRMIAQNRLPGAIRLRATVARIEIRPGVFREQTNEEYDLTEKQALKVATQSKTDKADVLVDFILDVFVAVRKGFYSATSQVAQPLANDNTAILLAILKEQRDQREQFDRQLKDQQAFTERMLDRVLQATQPRQVQVAQPPQQLSTQGLVKRKTRKKAKLSTQGSINLPPGKPMEASAQMSLHEASLMTVKQIAKVLGTSPEVVEWAIDKFDLRNPVYREPYKEHSINHTESHRYNRAAVEKIKTYRVLLTGKPN